MPFDLLMLLLQTDATSSELLEKLSNHLAAFTSAFFTAQEISNGFHEKTSKNLSIKFAIDKFKIGVAIQDMSFQASAKKKLHDICRVWGPCKEHMQ